MLFETVMEKEKKANLQYTAPLQNLQDFEQTPSMNDVKVTKLEEIKEEFWLIYYGGVHISSQFKEAADH